MVLLPNLKMFFHTVLDLSGQVKSRMAQLFRSPLPLLASSGRETISQIFSSLRAQSRNVSGKQVFSRSWDLESNTGRVLDHPNAGWDCDLSSCWTLPVYYMLV